MTISVYDDSVTAWKAARDAGIPSEWRLPTSLYPLPKDVTEITRKSGILDAKELDIIELTASAIATAIRERRYTAVQVTMAFAKAAAIAQQTTNCLTALFVDKALTQAQALDGHLEMTGEVVGPLHGVPVSIKDHIDIEGIDAPSGFLSLVGKMVAKQDSHLVSILRDAGAVFYCKTSNPQSLMHLETDCALGPTINPYNADLTSGGSSGGEGALLGMKGSTLGVGSDIGGSVRSPAAACGVYSFKPTALRLPADGINLPVCVPGYEGILPTQGPMARSVEDMALYMHVMAAAKPWLKEATLHVKPWREVQIGKLRVGVLHTDGVVRPVAAITRALDHALTKLKSCPDIELVEVEPLDGREAWDVISKLYWPDKGATVFRHCAASGEPVLPLTDWIIGHTKDNAGTLAESLELVHRRDILRSAMAKHWRSYGLDVLLTPVGPTPAPQLGTARYWNYTSFWNLVNYPAGTFPTGLSVDPLLDGQTYEATNEHEQHIKDTYTAKQSANAPLCLQVVGFVGHEEETLAAMQRITEICLK